MEGWYCGQGGQPQPLAPNNGPSHITAAFLLDTLSTLSRPVANFHYMYRKRGGAVEGGRAGEREGDIRQKTQAVHETRLMQPQSSFQQPFCSEPSKLPSDQAFLSAYIG